MKIGDIIRRKASDNAPIGPYMRIVAKHPRDNRMLFADTLGLDNPNVMIHSKHAYLHSMKSVCISEETLNALKIGIIHSVQHPACTAWLRLVDNPPELIRFYTKPKGYERIFVVERIMESISLGEKIVRIIVNNRVL